VPPSVPTVSVVGYGRFGAAFVRLCQAAGLSVRAFDPQAPIPDEIKAPSVADLVQGRRLVVVAVPMEALGPALEALSPNLSPSQVVCDVCSVKVMPTRVMAELWGSRQPWVATHPLFGPASLARGEQPLRVVVCPNTEHPSAVVEVEEFFGVLGCQTLSLSAEAHDREMALTHALVFFVAKAMLDVGVPPGSPYAPPSFQGMAKTIEAVRVDAGHLLPALHRFNPFAAAARHALLRALSVIDLALEATGPAPQGNDAATLGIPDLGQLSPELKETRELLDELDQELVALLARRAVLSKRAGRTKAALGVEVRDPARESNLLDARRRWATERGLNPDRVEDIFRSVLRFSRALQG